MPWNISHKTNATRINWIKILKAWFAKDVFSALCDIKEENSESVIEVIEGALMFISANFSKSGNAFVNIRLPEKPTASKNIRSIKTGKKTYNRLFLARTNDSFSIFMLFFIYFILDSSCFAAI
jgi:hypothetical protein